MTDVDLLVFGCAVSFIAVAGAYVALRERYLAHENAVAEEEPATAPVPVPVRVRKR
jgi:hypothetical protein